MKSHTSSAVSGPHRDPEPRGWRACPQRSSLSTRETLGRGRFGVPLSGAVVCLEAADRVQVADPERAGDALHAARHERLVSEQPHPRGQRRSRRTGPPTCRSPATDPGLATPTVRRRVHATRPRSPSAAPARVAEVVQASWPPLLQRSSPRIRCPGKRVRLRTLRWVVRAAAKPMPVSAELTLPRRGGGEIDWDPGGRVLRRGSRRCPLERGCGRTRWQR
jgi:hypothetical protein